MLVFSIVQNGEYTINLHQNRKSLGYLNSLEIVVVIDFLRNGLERPIRSSLWSNAFLNVPRISKNFNPKLQLVKAQAFSWGSKLNWKHVSLLQSQSLTIFPTQKLKLNVFPSPQPRIQWVLVPPVATVLPLPAGWSETCFPLAGPRPQRRRFWYQNYQAQIILWYILILIILIGYLLISIDYAQSESQDVIQLICYGTVCNGHLLCHMNCFLFQPSRRWVSKEAHVPHSVGLVGWCTVHHGGRIQ